MSVVSISISAGEEPPRLAVREARPLELWEAGVWGQDVNAGRIVNVPGLGVT